MELEYLDELPNIDFNDKRNNISQKINEWEKSDSKVLKLSCKSQAGKTNTTSAVRTYIKKNRKDFTLYLEKHSYNIYLVRS